MNIIDRSITIIAPAYNHEKFIEKCLWSIAGQNCPAMELIVIDDCSKDNTVQIIQKLFKDSRFKSAFQNGIKLIQHAKNQGAHDTINEGLEAASGNYLAVINTDDAYGNNRLNLLLNRCEEEEGEFAFGGIQSIDQFDSPVTSGYGQAIIKYQITAQRCPTVTMALTRGNSTISTGNMLFTRSLYHRLNGFRRYRYVHDWDFALRAALYTEPIFVPEAVYYYRLHQHNTISEISQNANAANMCETGSSENLENPLLDFFIHILRGKYENQKIPSKDVWEYFFQYKKYFDDDNDGLWAWEQAKGCK